jgi:hypothetical protein
MICRVVYILIMCHLSALGDVVNILFLKRKEKEKNFLLYFAIRRRNEGVVTHVGSHTTSATAQWRGLEHLDQLDPLSWEIWARPIGFMQR